MPDNQFNIGDRGWLINPRLGQEYMRGWEGEILNMGENSPTGATIQVRLFPPNNTTQWHDEWYYPRRFELISAEAGAAIQRTINKLMKRQKFYQTSKHQLPVWYASYGD